MARIIKIKNDSGAQGTWVGQVIENGEYYLIQENEITGWIRSSKVFNDIGSGNLIVNNGTDTIDDILDPIDGWNWLVGDTLPRSSLDNTKIAVHSSPKPITPNATTYAVWTGASDLVTGSPIPEMNIGIGDRLSFEFLGSPPPESISIDMKFDPRHGRVWIHEGYVKFEGAYHGDYMVGDVMAEGSLLQPYANLIGTIENNWFIPTPPGSPYAPTHGFAATPTLVPRTFSNDGDWDYDEATEQLTPNFTQTGGYKISIIERVIHRYAILPVCGDTTTFFILSSDETTELPAGYFVRITAHNLSRKYWMACVFLEIYRERTYVP